ncbi:unnamed protein product [Psylliodes chrysocephalus]|uniref:Uncharacterized protein n=1 Tax=Psylliodes chrysocephalus TaxID=3402493 RepID=A0A9P0CQL1_9CUCU|nr:unnamed protein product [Psylliodes chrysocephala]
MDKNSFFIPPSEGSKSTPEDHQMDTDDSPNSLENTLLYQSAENSPLNTSEINPESASNTTDRAASQNQVNNIKTSENRESAVVTNNISETTPDTFVSAYQTLPLPSSVTARVLNFRTDKNTTTSSEEENINKPPPPPQPLRPGLFTLPPPIKASTPLNTQVLLPKRKNTSPTEKDTAENDGEDETDLSDNQGFQKPRKFKKFKTNFVKLIERKATSTIPLTNKFYSLSESESEIEQDTVIAPKTKGKATPNLPIKGNLSKQTTKNIVTATKINKKATIPPIVVDGRTDNHATLTNNLKAIIKGKYSVKYTNATTVIFTEELEDYEALLGSIKQAEIPHHTYTNKAEKTHAFVLRGLANGTEKEAIEEDLIASYEIKPKEIFKMTTKHRPLFLVVTDPAITLDYLNKNVRPFERPLLDIKTSVNDLRDERSAFAFIEGARSCRSSVHREEKIVIKKELEVRRN